MLLGFSETVDLVWCNFLLVMADLSPSCFLSPTLLQFVSPLEESVSPLNLEQFLADCESESALPERASELDRETPATSTRPTLPVDPPTFAEATLEDLQRLQDKNKNKNTAKTTNTWVKRFEAWRSFKNMPYKLEEVPKAELDKVLQLFFAELRKKDGSEYEPESLRTMLASLDRFLREKGKQYSILRDREFESCRKVLNGKAIELRENGKGKRMNRADSLSEQEEEQLWQTGVLGSNNPKSLNYTVFFVLSQQFGTRGCQEHHQLRIEHFKFVSDTTGKTLSMEWVEGPTKTRPGGLSKTDRRLPQKIFAHGGDRCPIKLVELLISKRPHRLKATGPLYLRPLESPRKDVWYSLQPVGIHTINTYMKEIAKDGRLDCTNKKFTNHSVRKTTVKKLQKAGVSNDRIAAITGHRNEQSLRDYADADPEDHKALSGILCNHQPLRDLTNTQSSSVAPQYTFHGCTVYFGASMSCTQVNSKCSPPLQKKRRPMIESDSEED